MYGVNKQSPFGRAQVNKQGQILPKMVGMPDGSGRSNNRFVKQQQQLRRGATPYKPGYEYKMAQGQNAKMNRFANSMMSGGGGGRSSGGGGGGGQMVPQKRSPFSYNPWK